MRQVRKLLQEKKGMSLTSVLVAFVILMLGILMVSTAISAAGKITGSGVRMRELTEAAVESCLLGKGKNTGENTDTPEEKNIEFSLQGTSDSGFTISGVKIYNYVYTDEAGGDSFSLYYFSKDQNEE